MQDDNRIIHRTPDEARGGETPNILRWVLAFSLLAAILALSAIWILGAAGTDEYPDAPAATQAG